MNDCEEFWSSGNNEFDFLFFETGKKVKSNKILLILKDGKDRVYICLQNI